MRPLARLIAVLGATLIAASLAAAQDDAVAPADSPAADSDADAPGTIGQEAPATRQRPLGYELRTDDDRHYLQVWLRGQIRLSEPFDADPLDVAELVVAPGFDADIRRARLNARGHLFDPDLQFFYVSELSGDAPLLDIGVNLVLSPSLQLRIGQYKIPYNRERVDASSDQQFVERSISTYAFTIDRQRGITLRKRWAIGTAAQNRLITGVYEGAGRTSDQAGDEPMVMIRWEWDFLGEAIPFAQSDLRMRTTPAASVALGSARVDGPYTRFSTDGGGQLDGFEPGDRRRYRIEQWLQEMVWHYRGFSLQQEYHVKTILDRDTARESELTGGYVQLGKVWPITTRSRALPVELAFRYARVAWSRTPADRTQQEHSVVFNVFFEGHRNKLSFDLSRLDLEEAAGPKARDTRFRAQWEVSF